MPAQALDTMAFPNAYLSTDEPPRSSVLRRVLCLVAAAGFSYLGLVILLLSLLTNAYSPVSPAASDYGVGADAVWMNSGFFVAGVGMAGLAGTLVFSQEGRALRSGGALMLVSGAALIFDSLFATDIEGAPSTFHGDVHSVAGVAFFLLASLAVILISRGIGRNWFVSVSLGLLAALVFLALDGIFALDAGGLGERVVILVVFSSTIMIAVQRYRQT